MNPYETEKTAILLASYNGGGYIREQIDSLLAQSEENWELFIHDDGSSDDTVEICQEYTRGHPNKIHLISGAPTGGAKNNFFYLLQNVRAPYYMFCDQDDYWKKDKILHTLQAMQKAEGCTAETEPVPVLVFTDLEVADADLGTISESMNQYQKLDTQKTKFTDLMVQNIITGCTVMINEALAALMRKSTSTDLIIMHDWWAGLIAAKFGTIIYLPEAAIKYRQHGSNEFGAYRVTDAAFLRSKVSKKDEIHNSLKATQLQTACFLETFGVEDKVLEEYAVLYDESKWKRLAFYRKNHIRMSGLLRSIGLIVFG